MVGAGKKVNFYRLALRRGRMHRMTISADDRLTGEGGGVFAYLAPVFDSSDYEGTWHRLRLEGKFSDCKYEIVVAATDVDLKETLSAEECSLADALELLKSYGYVRKVNTDDMLLHGIKGRYLWIFLTVAGSRIDSSFRIEGFSVEFPQSSFVEYLPEIYQQERDSFFERYMAVLQSLYEDLEREVDRVPVYLDYETAPDQNLTLFAEWTGHWNQSHQWTPEQMRYLIGHLQKLQSGRGTWTVMEEMIRLLTGKKAFVVEHFKWKDWMRSKSSLLEEYYRIYGEDEDTFVVIIDCTAQEIGMSERTLEQKLDDYTPLGMKCKVVFLKNSSRMDTQSYLDKNSYLSTPQQPTTGEMVLGGEYRLG